MEFILIQEAAKFVENVHGKNAMNVLSHFVATIVALVVRCTSVKSAPNLHTEKLLNVMDIECRII